MTATRSGKTSTPGKSAKPECDFTPMIATMMKQIDTLALEMKDLKSDLVGRWTENAEHLSAKFECLRTDLEGIKTTVMDLDQRVGKHEDRIAALERMLEDQRTVGRQPQQQAWVTVRGRNGSDQRPDQGNVMNHTGEYDKPAFKMTGVPEEENETDRDLAKKADNMLRSTLEKHPEYAGKTYDRVNFKITSARRLGRPGDRPRLVHFTVESSFDATSIIRNRRFLKGSGISVLDYLSKEEFSSYKANLPKFLEARKDTSKWVTFRRGELRITNRNHPTCDKPMQQDMEVDA